MSEKTSNGPVFDMKEVFREITGGELPYPGTPSLHDRLVAMVRRLEWASEVAGDGEALGSCPVCGGVEFRGHKPGCELAALLEEVGRGT